MRSAFRNKPRTEHLCRFRPFLKTSSWNKPSNENSLPKNFQKQKWPILWCCLQSDALESLSYHLSVSQSVRACFCSSHFNVSRRHMCSLEHICDIYFVWERCLKISQSLNCGQVILRAGYGKLYTRCCCAFLHIKMQFSLSVTEKNSETSRCELQSCTVNNLVYFATKWWKLVEITITITSLFCLDSQEEKEPCLIIY